MEDVHSETRLPAIDALTARQTHSVPSTTQDTHQDSPAEKQMCERQQVSILPVAHYMSAPTGDQTLSYIHGLKEPYHRAQTLNALAVLPGICKNLHQKLNVVQKVAGMPSKEGSLFTKVVNDFQSYSISKLESILAELRNFDSILSGFVPQSHLSLLLLSYDLPLHLPTLKQLLERFSKPSNPTMVHYVNLLNFLKTAMLSNMHQKLNVSKTSKKNSRPWDKQKALQPDVSETKCIGQFQVPKIWEPKGDRKRDSSTEADQLRNQSSDDEQLLMKLQKQFKKYQVTFRMERLYQSFQESDRSLTGFLTPKEIKAISHKLKLPIPESIIEALIRKNSYCKDGMINWRKFLNFLERAQPVINSTPTSNPYQARAPSQHWHLNSNWSDLDFITVQDSLKASQAKMKDRNHNSGSDNPCRGGKVQKIPNRSRRLGIESVVEQDKEMKLHEKNWIDRFTRLERALHLLDNRTTGGLYQCEARRVINNYNLIHHLNLRPQKIQEALDKFQFNGKVIVEPILRYLKEL